MAEHELHVAVAQFLDLALPDDATWTTIGHGGYRLNVITAARLKRLGLKPGWPDVIILWKGKFIGIELKNVTGRPTADQAEVARQICLAGGLTTVAYSLDDVINFLDMIGMNLKVAA